MGNGWLTFDLPEADMGCHPTHAGPPSGTLDISFYCDDVKARVAEGVRLTGEVDVARHRKWVTGP